MADEKSNFGKQDDVRVAGDQSYELSYLEEKFNVSREEVRAAIGKVGNDRAKLEKYLKEK